ncbi:MAG TPA: hypothetical protein VJ868_06630 [Actinomycetota bacterium]|nr:hypothetical protein [Actinomycetota bacterium]
MTRLREMSISIAVVAVLLTHAGSFSAIAQETRVAEDWRATRAETVGVMLDLDPADNVLTVGETIDSVVTRKHSPNGILRWERVIPPPPDRARASWISADPAGNAIVTAYHVTGENFSPAGWLVVKYGPLGNVIWRDDIPVAHGRTVRVETDDAGNAYVTGTMFLGTTTDAVTIKYAPNGAKRWTRSFNGGAAAADVPSSVAVTPDGSRIATVGRSGPAFFTVIYDAQGDVIRRNVRTDLGTAHDAAFGPKKELYVGTSRYTQATSDQMTIVKFGASGATLWTRSYAAGDFIHRIAVDHAGNVISVGVVDTYFDWVTLKVAPNGDRLWARRYSATEGDDEVPAFLAIDAANAIYVTGRAGPIPPGPGVSLLMMTTIKYAPAGSLVWRVNRDINRGVGVRVGTDQAAYVLGEGLMLTVRYTQSP